MAITSLDGYIAAAKQQVRLQKNAATSVAAQWHTLFDRGGNPGAGSLSIGNTSAGVVPTDATAGCPTINAFGGGNTGYLTRAMYSSTVAGRFYLADRLFHAGSVSATANATTSLTSQPSYVGRLPGSSYAGLDLWVEINAAVSNNACNVSIGYRNQANSDVTSATVSVQNFATGRLVQIPLNAGDTEIKQVNSVIISGTAATTGSVNVIVARPLYLGARVPTASGGDVHGLDRVGLVQIYEDSALWLAYAADSTSTGVADVLLEIANG